MKVISVPDELRAAAARPNVRGQVMSALETAAQRTGADFSYLLKTATRESSLNPAAKAATSSATGLFQFIEQTWLATVKKHGAEHGLESYAAQIEQGADGRYKIAAGGDRQAILALRKDPNAAAAMAGELTVDMAQSLRDGLGRAPTSGELYAAHVMGPGGALKLIRAAQSNPGQSAADLFPAAAKANRSIFYTADGADRSAQGVLARLTAKHDGAAPVQMAALDERAAAPVVRTAELRGSYAVSDAPEPVRVWRPGDSESYVLSPVMVQIMASMDDGLIRLSGEDASERKRPAL
jgi:hypothetical protein